MSLPVVICVFACCSPLSTKATSAFQAASGRSRNSNSLGGGTGEANSLLIKTTSTRLNVVRREWLNSSGVGGPTSEGMDALCQFWLQTENTRGGGRSSHLTSKCGKMQPQCDSFFSFFFLFMFCYCEELPWQQPPGEDFGSIGTFTRHRLIKPHTIICTIRRGCIRPAAACGGRSFSITTKTWSVARPSETNQAMRPQDGLGILEWIVPHSVIPIVGWSSLGMHRVRPIARLLLHARFHPCSAAGTAVAAASY